VHEALTRCANRGHGPQFAFCLVDSNSPATDGLEFARVLRGQPFGGKIRIVSMVANESPAQLSEAQKAGINSFVVKPLRKKPLAMAFSRAAANPESQDSASTLTKPATHGCCGGPASILLVEDNVVNQKVASNSLLKLGYAVEVASNGLQAIDAFERRQFDLILMDCHMPVMDGYTATQKIRACGVSGRYVPIIAMTADVVETQRERCIAAGMNDFLSKPVRRDVLSGMLEHWLAQA
jgi:CheY-like chemotaxis protein